MSQRADDDSAGAATDRSGANPPDPGAAAVRVWKRVARVLTPIVGTRGFEALYRRSLHLTREAHPSLGPVHAGPADVDGFDALRAALDAVPPAAAMAAQAAQMQALCDLLTALIGHSLVERLLADILPNLSTDGASAAQETPS